MWANAQRDGRPAEYRWGGALCSTPESLADANTGMPCSNSAKTRNPLKFAGVPKLANKSQPLVGRSSPYYEDMWGRYCRLRSFFPIVDICLTCEDIARQSCGMVPRWRLFGDFLRAVFSASRAQHVADLHCKFTLRPHHVWKYGRHPVSDRAEIRRGKKKKERRNHIMKIYMACPIT